MNVLNAIVLGVAVLVVAGCSAHRDGAKVTSTPSPPSSQPATAATPPAPASGAVAPGPEKPETPAPPSSAAPPAPDTATPSVPPAPTPEPAPKTAETPTTPPTPAPAPPPAPQRSTPPAPSAPKTAAVPKPQARPAPAAAPLDLPGLEKRLRDTKAIGVFTKLSLKNQVDDLIADFKTFHARSGNAKLEDLRERYNGLMLKVLSLLQRDDPPLARDLSASREALWTVLADPVKFAQISGGG